MCNISVIVPIYKPREDLFIRTLQSLNSNINDIYEIIFIDNGSPLDVEYLVESYIEDVNKYTIISLEYNKGFSYACNLAIKNVKGDYFHICDSDDILLKDAYSSLYQNENISWTEDIIVFSAVWYDINKRTYFTTVRSTQTDHYIPLNLLNKKVTFNQIASKLLATYYPCWDKLFRVDYIRENDFYFDESLPTMMPDILYTFTTYSFASSIIFVPQKVYSYSIGENGVVTSIKKDISIFENQVLTFADRMKELSSHFNDSSYKEAKKIISFIELSSIKEKFNQLTLNQKKAIYSSLRKRIIEHKEIVKLNLLKDFNLFIWCKTILLCPNYFLFSLYNFTKEKRQLSIRINIFTCKYDINNRRIRKYFLGICYKR